MRSLPLVLTAALAAMGGSIAAELPPASKQTGVTYAKDIRPIFEASCFSCHGPKRAKEDLRLDTLAFALKGGEHGKVIIPGDSAKSSLVTAVARIDPDTAMPPPPKGKSKGAGPAGAPPPAKPLTPEQVGLVRAWIDQGAK
jgi:mono/diheme cytochrome c family protein